MTTNIVKKTRAPSGADEAAAPGRMAPGDREPEPHVLLLSGAPGVGKTTVVRRLARVLEGKRLGGFYTEEVCERGVRRGFRLVSLAGAERVIAHVDFPKHHRVGKYSVDVAAVDEAAALLKPDASTDVVVVDEVGRMECLSARFVAAVRALLAGTTPVVATVAIRGGGLIAEVKESRACVFCEVTHGNRRTLPDRIAAWLDP